MNRRHVNAAITAGLALTMTVGSVPPQAFAEMMQGDTTQVVAEQSDATGAAATSADTGQATSQDQSEDKIASFASLNELHVAEGSDATLPQTVTATYESGTTKQENVIWKLNGADAPATLAQLPAGSYEFEGTVDGTTQTVKQRVVIEAAAADPAAVNAPDATETSNESGITVESIDANPILEKYVGADYYGQIQSSSVKVKLSDGTETSAYVNWDEKSQAAFDTATEESEIPITGQITGVSVNSNWVTLAEPYEVSGVLKVYVPRSTSNGSWAWTAAGIAPALPSSMSASYSNGQSYTCPVEWNEISADQYQKEGTFVVEGHLKNYPSMLAQCTVAVRSVKSVQTELTCTTLTGEVPSLPYSASVVFDSGATEQIPVSWDSFDASLYSKVGSFTVKGKLNGFDYREITCTVTVKDPKDVLDLNSLRFERVVGDISPLSTYVYFPVSQSNNTTYTQGYQVNWDNADVSQFQKAGTYTVTGTLVTYNESSTANGLKVTAQVEVKEVASIDALAPVNTPVGVRPTTGGGLPYSVEVAFTDGTKKQCNIAWDPILDAQVASEGSFKLSGSLSYWTNTSSSSSSQVELGDSNRATATISVRALQMPSSTSTSTLIGCQPNMPGSIEATMWNGSRGSFPVQWSTISQDALKNLGQITVNGYFTGSNIPVTATVNVCDLKDSNIGKIAYVPGVGLLAPRYLSDLYLSDGSSFYPRYSSGQPYSWDEFPQELLDGKPGEYEITGTVSGSLAKIHATAVCGEVKGVNNYSDNGVTLGRSYEDWRVIYPGEEVNLDYLTVSGALQDGTTFDSLGVNWDAYDRCPQKDCTITGTVVGTNIPVKVHVIVTKNWEAQPQTITVLKGSDGTAMLPSHVELVSPDATDQPGYSNKYAEAKWNTKGFDWTQGGVVRGTATISFGTGNGMQTVDVPITATVKIASKATSVQGGTIWTVPGTKPMLPEYLEVRYDNDVSSEPQREKVTWDRVAEDAYAKDGSFKVKGKLQGGAEATITVDVCSVTSFAVPERITTANGVVPELPWNVSVATSDGKTHNAHVEWGDIRPSVYTGEPGQVTTVSGALFTSDLNGYGVGINTGLTVQTKIVIQGVEKAIDNGETAVTTKAGTAPTMPSKMAVEMSDGSVSTAAIDWDPIAPEKYEQPGTFYATGHVVGFDAAAVMALLDDDGQKVGVDENGNVTAKVTVADKKAKKVALQPEAVVVNTTVGSMLELPECVNINYSDGTFTAHSQYGGTEIEKWTDTDGLDLSKPIAKKGTYKLVGKLKDVDNVNAIVYVNVSEAPRTITKLEAKSFSVAKGTPKQDLYQQMPKQVVATYSDGSTDLLDIDTWDLSNVTDEVLNGTSTVQITGTVKLNGAKVTCNVTVVDQDAETPDHVEPVADIHIADNAKVADLMDKLPSKVTVVMKDGKTKNETPVKWSQVDSLGRAGNEFEVTGLTDNGMTVKVKVKVIAHIVSLDAADDIEVERDTKASEALAKLPKKVTAVYSDGLDAEVDVKWDTKGLSDKDFAKEGKVTVKGTVAGTDQKAECTIKVVKPLREIPDRLAGTVDAVTVDDGAKPEAVVAALPTTVKVTMKDGSEVDSKINWTAPKEALTIKKDGTSVVVTGKTEVGNFDVNATVNLMPVVESVVDAQLSVARNTAAADIALPAQVTLNMSDGSKKTAAVTWDKAPLTTDALGKLGDIALEGTVEGTSVKAACTVTVVKSDAEIPLSVEPVAGVNVPEGASVDVVRDALKGVKATVRMKDGKTTAESEITWTEVPAAAATYGSTVVAKGVTVNGNLPVDVVVTSTTTINKVAEAPQITVERDAKADTVTGQLPKKVTVTYSDGHTDEAAVTWNTDGLDKQLAAVGEHTLEGSVEGTTLKATCKLVVETPASEIPVRPATFAPVEVFEASSAADVLKALPKKVSVMMKDDSQEDYDVDWENVPALDWGADDVTVGGKVRGTELTVSCMVRVKPRPAAKGLVIVDQNGKATTAETVLKVERGKEIDLAAAASNAADGALLRGAVTWVSSDPTIATVENGKVKALKNGTVVITATMPVDGDAAAIATLAEDDAAETPAPQQLTASVTVEVVEPVVVQEPTGGKDNGAKPDAKDPSGKKNGKKAAKGSLAETGDNTAVAVAALGGTGLLALIAAAIEKLRHRAE